MPVFSPGADGVYRCIAFDEQFHWQRHGFGTRWNNPKADITLRQIHSAIIWSAEEVSADRSREGDALITGEINRSVGVRTADCVPLLLLDTTVHAVGAVHAGWRGTVAGIARRAVESLTATFGTDPARVYAAIGPCIRSCCYEVGEQVAEQFDSQFQRWSGASDKPHLDLAAANRHQLESAGVPSQQIFDCERCTACDLDLFFSYRRQPDDPGRMVAAICRLR